MPVGTSLSGNRYRYAGKEIMTAASLGWLDFGARMYDSYTGRWLSQDPLAEKYPSISPYAYCANNPMNLVDPEGKIFRRLWKRNTITIRSDIYTDSHSKASAIQAASYWNNRKQDTYFIGNKQYSVYYDIRINQVDKPLQSISKSFNTYEIRENVLSNGKRVSGKNEPRIDGDEKERSPLTGYHITVDESYSITLPFSDKSSSTGSHEIGHLLGIIPHTNLTIMSKSQDDMRTQELSQEQINAIIESDRGIDSYDLIHWFNHFLNHDK